MWDDADVHAAEGLFRGPSDVPRPGRSRVYTESGTVRRVYSSFVEVERPRRRCRTEATETSTREVRPYSTAHVRVQALYSCTQRS